MLNKFFKTITQNKSLGAAQAMLSAIGIKGDNGSGKSTLINIMLGLINVENKNNNWQENPFVQILGRATENRRGDFINL